MGTALAAAFAQQAGRITLDSTQLEQAAATLSLAAQSLPEQDTLLLPQLRRLGAQPGVNLVPSPRTPINMSTFRDAIFSPVSA